MAGTWPTTTPSIVESYSQFRTLTYTWTGDAVTGAVPDMDIEGEELNFIKGWYLYQVSTAPGDTAPAASYDITIETPGGFDVARGLLADRSATAEEVANPQAWPIDGQLTIKIANQSEAGGQGIIKLWVAK